MALDKNSNGFTFGFAAILVIVVGTILATLAVVLKEPQQANLKQEKMKAILMATGVMTADDDMATAPAIFEKVIKKRLVVSAVDGSIKSENSGEISNDKGDAFNIELQKIYAAKVKPIKGKYKKDPTTMIAKIKELDLDWPLYVAEIDGQTLYVIPMEGTGLWGPIWGYVTFEGDLNTIKGVTLAHKGETPGLGAEIATTRFQKQYIGKTIFNDGKYCSIRVHKGGGGAADPHGVDGITGGTITSVATGEMFYRSLDLYVPYFNTLK
tara:strand:+ start:13442 stop:14242 length:801 start_codon:yes stop_codon:yes gene_type:complete